MNPAEAMSTTAAAPYTGPSFRFEATRTPVEVVLVDSQGRAIRRFPIRAALPPAAKSATSGVDFRA